MAGNGDLEVSPAAVKSIQDGLRAAIGELGETGDTVTSTGRIGSLKDLLEQAKRDGDGH